MGFPGAHRQPSTRLNSGPPVAARTDKDVGEAFTILTIPPGPDIAPYHDRQIAILDRADWAAWLDPSISAKAILKRLAAGSLGVERVG